MLLLALISDLILSLWCYYYCIADAPSPPPCLYAILQNTITTAVAAMMMPLLLMSWCRRCHDAAAVTFSTIMPPLSLLWYHCVTSTTAMLPPLSQGCCHDASPDAGMMPPPLSLSLIWCRHWCWHDAASAVAMILSLPLTRRRRRCRFYNDAIAGASQPLLLL